MPTIRTYRSEVRGNLGAIRGAKLNVEAVGESPAAFLIRNCQYVRGWRDCLFASSGIMRGEKKKGRRR